MTQVDIFWYSWTKTEWTKTMFVPGPVLMPRACQAQLKRLLLFLVAVLEVHGVEIPHELSEPHWPLLQTCDSLSEAQRKDLSLREKGFL